MALLIEGKKQIVAEVNEVASKAFSAVVADYQGLNVEQLTQLRVEARKLGVTTRIVRNTLAKRSFEGTQFDILNAQTGVGLPVSSLSAVPVLSLVLKDHQLAVFVMRHDLRCDLGANHQRRPNSNLSSIGKGQYFFELSN